MPDLILPIVSFAISSAFTPGPNNIMVAASGANFGYRATIRHILGIAVGFPLMIIAVGLGFGGLFTAWPPLHWILKIAGSVFLLFLAVKIARFHPAETEGTKSKPLTFWQAVAFQWLNPKAWVVILVAIPTFTRDASIFSEILLIALIFLAVSFPAASSWTLFGTTFRRWLRKERIRKIFNLSLAFLLVIALALTWLIH